MSMIAIIAQIGFIILELVFFVGIIGVAIILVGNFFHALRHPTNPTITEDNLEISGKEDTDGM